MNTYNKRGSTPIYWFNKAMDIKASAGVIWLAIEEGYSPNIENKLGFGKGFSLKIACHQTFLMLCGLSLELLFKSIILSKNIKIPQTHNLYKLLTLCQIEYTQNEIEIINILSNYVIWSWKYPIPKTKEDYDKFLDAQQKYFWEKEKNSINKSGMIMLRRKASFNWENFDTIWKIGNNIFWKYNR